MFISKAYAAADTAAPAVTAAAPPGAGEAFMLNMLLVVILVVMFYVLLIMPQQKRFKKHAEMINALKKGDKVITAGGFLAIVDSIPEDKKDEVVLDLGHGTKVTALRSTIQNRTDDRLKNPKAADKDKKEEKK